jgi:hypothetical protein
LPEKEGVDLNNAATWIIAALVIIPALYFLLRSIRQEALEGKCASCYHSQSCSDGCCAGAKKQDS